MLMHYLVGDNVHEQMHVQETFETNFINKKNEYKEKTYIKKRPLFFWYINQENEPLKAIFVFSMSIQIFF